MRMIRFGDYPEFFGSEWSQSDSVERVLIPRLEREYGPNHRLVHEARLRAEQLRKAEFEQARAEMIRIGWIAQRLGPPD